MSGKGFTHLHLHSQYSLLDGAISLDKLLKQCGKLGMESVAVTDHTIGGQPVEHDGAFVVAAGDAPAVAARVGDQVRGTRPQYGSTRGEMEALRRLGAVPLKYLPDDDS